MTRIKYLCLFFLSFPTFKFVKIILVNDLSIDLPEMEIRGYRLQNGMSLCVKNKHLKLLNNLHN